MECIIHTAASLDGYIADPDGGIDWLTGISSDPTLMDRVNAFIDSCDTLVVGRLTYEQMLGFGDWPYPNHYTIVVTQTMSDFPSPKTLGCSVENLKTALQRVGANKVWVVGGGQVNQYMLANGFIDRIYVTVAPVILGAGRPLFPGLPRHRRLQLVGSVTLPDNFIELAYDLQT